MHPELCMLRADLQESEGRGWAFEQPGSAKSRVSVKVKHRVSHGSYTAKLGQCGFGVVSKASGTPIRSRARMVTSLVPLVKKLPLQALPPRAYACACDRVGGRRETGRVGSALPAGLV